MLQSSTFNKKWEHLFHAPMEHSHAVTQLSTFFNLKRNTKLILDLNGKQEILYFKVEQPDRFGTWEIPGMV
jgi:hypothetical protein